MRFMKTNGGFTLAEVLITLGIIGVVAAMTLPAVINNTQHKELSAALNKYYSIMQQALLKMYADEGQPINGINYQRLEFREKYAKYFIGGKSGWTGAQNEENEEGGTDYVISDYKTFNGKKKVHGGKLDDGLIISQDIKIYMDLESTDVSKKPIMLTIDINGGSKGPNRWGHDFFTFQVMDNGKLLPMGAPDSVYNDKSLCSVSSGADSNGVACTYYALTDKNYFKNLPK